MHPSAIREYGEILSREVTSGDWVLIGGEVVRADGLTIEGHLDAQIAQRTAADGSCHWVIPDEIVAADEATWTTGGARGLTLQGQRWKTIREAISVAGKEGDVLASKLLADEAEAWGTKVGSTTPGKAPGTGAGGLGSVEKSEPAAPRLPGPSTNPWSPQYRGSPEQQRAEQIAIISSKGGPALAASLSKSCGVDLAGRPLRAVKGY